jgi:hypothetical protein
MSVKTTHSINQPEDTIMTLFHLLPINPTDQPIDLMDDTDFVCEFNVDTSEQLESLDDAINARYREIWS